MKRSAVLVLAICSFSGCAPPAAPTPVPPRPVIVSLVEPAKATVTRSFSGVTRAANSAEVAFEIPGRITEIVAVRGRRYEAGEVLARLDVTTVEAELRSAKAESTRAGEELRRVQQLFETDNASRAQFDSALAMQQTAQANLAAATKRVEVGTIRMPYSGVIGDVLKEEQEFVAAGTPLIRIQGDGGMELEVGIPSDIIPSVDTGMSAVVTLGSLPGSEISGQVSKVSREVTRNTTFVVTISLTAPSGLEIREGLDGEAAFELPIPPGPSLTVPAECVVGAPPKSTFVWTVKRATDGTGRVERREVTTGSLRPSGQIEILQGIEAGQLVVTRGVHQLMAGQAVRVELREGS